MRKIIKFISLIILLSVLILCILVPVWFYNLDAPSKDAGKERAEEIILALEEYKKENGFFPTVLSVIEPTYIEHIPLASLRHSYCYDLQEDQAYTLAFVPKGEAIGDGWVVYWSKYDDWKMSDSDFVQPCYFFDRYE